VRRVLRALAPALLWAVFVLYIGGRSSVPSPAIDLPLDKVAHFTMYGILGLLAARVARQTAHRFGWWWFIAGGLLLGMLDELQQRRIPSRSADPLDWIADAVGFTLGFWLVYRHRFMIRNGGRDES
jgi:VanZ family protein